MTFKEFTQTWTPQIDHYLQTELAAEVTDQEFGKIMAYSVLAGGKRLRPLLFLASLAALDYPLDAHTLRAACGIELIHTYSLIHDDLPAMDNDDYRRGHLTSHKRWGEAQAILAGDALLPLGIEWLGSATHNAMLPVMMARAIGPNGMAGGQYLDIDATNNATVATDGAYLERMEWLKTGCLIQASVEMAAELAEATPEARSGLVTFAKKFGRAYQIYDDLVDVVETSSAAGKKTHKDEATGKNNTLTLTGIARSRERLTALMAEAQSALAPVDQRVLAGFLDLFKQVL